MKKCTEQERLRTQRLPYPQVAQHATHDVRSNSGRSHVPYCSFLKRLWFSVIVATPVLASVKDVLSRAPNATGGYAKASVCEDMSTDRRCCKKGRSNCAESACDFNGSSMPPANCRLESSPCSVVH